MLKISKFALVVTVMVFAILMGASIGNIYDSIAVAGGRCVDCEWDGSGSWICVSGNTGFMHCGAVNGACILSEPCGLE